MTSLLEDEEKKDLEYLLRLLLFENHGAFVLFGSKPLCDAHLMNTDDTEVDQLEHQQLLASMSSEERIEYQLALKKLEERQGRGEITFERNPYKGWLALEKVLEKLTIKKYVVVFDRNGLHNARCENMILLANIQRVALVLAENYSIFQQASGMDFHPLEMALELKNPRSKFWNNVFKIDNHFAKGLLFGFGKKILFLKIGI